MAGTPAAFLASAFNGAAFQTGGGIPPEPDDTPPLITYGGGHDYEQRVRSHWARIEALRAERQERERQETQRAAELEEARHRVERARKAAAAVEAKKRKAAEQRIAKAEAEVTALETELGWLGETTQSLQGQIDAILEQIEVERAAAEMQRAAELTAQAEYQAMLARRRMMMALLLTVQ